MEYNTRECCLYYSGYYYTKKEQCSAKDGQEGHMLKYVKMGLKYC
jgi:hypothetical protein